MFKTLFCINLKLLVQTGVKLRSDELLHCHGHFGQSLFMRVPHTDHPCLSTLELFEKMLQLSNFSDHEWYLLAFLHHILIMGSNGFF